MLSTDNKAAFRDESSGRPVHSIQTCILIALWSIVRATLFRYSPRHLYFIRRWLLVLFGAKLASRVYIYPCVRIEYPWNLTMDHYSSIGRGVWIYNLGPVEIGKYVTISQRVSICGGTHDYTDRSFPLICKPIKIEDGAWLAAEAFICPGVAIGANAVVGARSVVTKDIPANAICAGNPCKVIKTRNDID